MNERTTMNVSVPVELLRQIQVKCGDLGIQLEVHNILAARPDSAGEHLKNRGLIMPPNLLARLIAYANCNRCELTPDDARFLAGMIQEHPFPAPAESVDQQEPVSVRTGEKSYSHVTPTVSAPNAGELGKPCPFCGHEGISVYEGSTFRWRYAACDGCGAQAGEIRCQTLGDGTKEEWEAAAHKEAIGEWNKRAADHISRQSDVWGQHDKDIYIVIGWEDDPHWLFSTKERLRYCMAVQIFGSSDSADEDELDKYMEFISDDDNWSLFGTRCKIDFEIGGIEIIKLIRGNCLEAIRAEAEKARGRG